MSHTTPNKTTITRYAATDDLYRNNAVKGIAPAPDHNTTINRKLTAVNTRVLLTVKCLDTSAYDKRQMHKHNWLKSRHTGMQPNRILPAVHCAMVKNVKCLTAC